MTVLPIACRGVFFDLYGTFWREGLLDQQLKEVVRLRNARLTDCGY